MNESGKHFAILRDIVMANSVANTWADAVKEWDVVGYRDSYRDKHATGREMGPSCICMQENLRYLFTIENRENGNRLFPIGSRCIKRFGVKEMDHVVNRWKAAGHLFSAKGGRMGKTIVPVNGDHFSKDFLEFLMGMGVFVGSEHNGFDGAGDYAFMVDMFNMRREPTLRQKRKIAAVLLNQVYPWLDKTIGEDGGFNYGDGGDTILGNHGDITLQDGFSDWNRAGVFVAR